MKKLSIGVLLSTLIFISLNSNATLDKRTYCNGSIIHWNLYQITFEAFSHDSAIGDLEFWMGFNKNGAMIPSIYMFSYDKFLSSPSVAVNKNLTYLNLLTNNAEGAKGCFATFKIEGTSNSTYNFVIQGSGFISRDNANPSSDADYFTLNNAIVDYAGLTKWGKLTFTQIR
jgi:hypothetical protein